jgi:hypothetical protein
MSGSLETQILFKLVEVGEDVATIKSDLGHHLEEHRAAQTTTQSRIDVRRNTGRWVVGTLLTVSLLVLTILRAWL